MYKGFKCIQAGPSSVFLPRRSTDRDQAACRSTPSVAAVPLTPGPVKVVRSVKPNQPNMTRKPQNELDNGWHIMIYYAPFGEVYIHEHGLKGRSVPLGNEIACQPRLYNIESNYYITKKHPPNKTPTYIKHLTKLSQSTNRGGFLGRPSWGRRQRIPIPDPPCPNIQGKQATTGPPIPWLIRNMSCPQGRSALLRAPRPGPRQLRPSTQADLLSGSAGGGHRTPSSHHGVFSCSDHKRTYI